MNHELLLRHFNRISEAPGAVLRLRRFILDLAMRGKLVQQDPLDEPAIELLKRIQVQKTKGVKKGKTTKLVSRIEPDELPFRPPFGWEFARISLLSELENGDRSKNYPSRDEFVSMGIPFINAGHLQLGRVDLTTMNYISESRFNLLKSGKVQTGDILFCLRGSLGKSAIVSNISRGAIASSLVIIRLLGEINPHFVLGYLFSSLAIEMVSRYDNGTAQPNLSSGDLGRFVVPLPPLAEQGRIVAKVEELMNLCDRLDAMRAEQETRRDRLTAACHQKVNKGATTKAFREHANFYLGHFPRVTANPAHVQQLRQTILSLAVRGKLVRQNPGDEPASALLKRIRERRLSDSGVDGIKDNKVHRSIDANDVPFDIPNTWKWTVLCEITEIGTGSTPSRTQPAFWNGTIPWVSSGSTSFDTVTQPDECVTDAAVKAHRLRLYQPGTLLVALYGQGKTRGQVAELGIESTINQACAAICPTPGFAMLIPYIKLLLKEHYHEIRSLAAGGAQPNLNVQKIKQLLVPMPPVSEQGHIVAKVSELMAVLDRLEVQLTSAQEERSRLLESVLYHALASPEGTLTGAEYAKEAVS